MEPPPRITLAQLCIYTFNLEAASSFTQPLTSGLDEGAVSGPHLPPDPW